MFSNWNEKRLKHFLSIHWRASLVPAAALIPAPTVYAKVVAVEKLVVGFWASAAGPSQGVLLVAFASPSVLCRCS